MRGRRRFAPIVGLGLLILLPAVAAAIQAPAASADIAGVYYCDGVNGDGTAYHGMVTIAREGDAYYLRWDLQPPAAAVGLGLREGDTLGVSYYGHATGVIVYRIEGKRLIGRWTVPGASGPAASETLTPVGDEPVRRPEPAAPAPAVTGAGAAIRL